MYKHVVVVVALLVLIAGLPAAHAENFPPEGTTPCRANVGLLYLVSDLIGPTYCEFSASTTTDLSYGPVQVDEGGHRYIDTQLGAVTLTGWWYWPERPREPDPGTFTITSATGRMTSRGYPEGDFPAESFFDVFVSFTGPDGNHAAGPVRMTGMGDVSGLSYGDSCGVFCLDPNCPNAIREFGIGLTVVPEPAGLLALAGGLLPLGGALYRRVRR
jgi:hypothetical protein